MKSAVFATFLLFNFATGSCCNGENALSAAKMLADAAGERADDSEFDFTGCVNTLKDDPLIFEKMGKGEFERGCKTIATLDDDITESTCMDVIKAIRKGNPSGFADFQKYLRGVDASDLDKEGERKAACENLRKAIAAVHHKE